ncbi:MAG: ribonuclease J [Candidatus Shapirobacteria bacterium]|nr:ribonuclease J [Candidatus Shapirobacteria bacterium]
MIFKRKENNNQSTLKIISFGGFGNVTQNLFVYEYQNNILVVDCGVGFMEKANRKTELAIPDFTYLIENQDKIRAIILTHGHDDHIGGLPFLLTKIKRPIPIYASRWTAAMVEEKLEEQSSTVRVKVINSETHLNLGVFSVDFIYVTHSVPDSYHLIIGTPNGLIYHGSDFKFDWTPVSGRQSDVDKIALLSHRGINLLLSDCLRSENSGYTLSEEMIEESFEREIHNCKGKFFVTTMSSNVSRWQQALNVIAEHRRKAVFVGRSVEKVIKIAIKLGYLHLPQGIEVPLNKIRNYQPQQLAFLISGSQAQFGSALEKTVYGRNPQIKIQPGDKVVFSTDYIPGSELAIHHLIDKLSYLGADVSYSDISDNLHVSGHGAQADQALLISLVRPKYLLPIGGAFRQMKQYALQAQKMGYEEKQILLPERTQTIEMLSDGQVRLGAKINLRPGSAM